MEVDHYRPKRYQKPRKSFVKSEQATAVEEPSKDLPFWQYVGAQQAAAAERTKRQIQCWKCRKFGHIARQCRVPGQGN
jgi:hypothetical protein